MYIANLVQLVNRKLANELLSETELLIYMDSTIDDINANLNTTFPTFSEVIAQAGVNNPDYQAIPNRYLRSVVIVGTAVKYYEADEEGNQSAISFVQDYRQQLFYMLRDYSFNVPAEYRAENQGFVNLSDEKMNTPGLQLASNNPFDTDGTVR